MATILESRLSTQVLARWCSVRQENLGNPRLLVGGPEETPSVVFGGNSEWYSSSQASKAVPRNDRGKRAKKPHVAKEYHRFTFTQAVVRDVAGA